MKMWKRGGAKSARQIPMTHLDTKVNQRQYYEHIHFSPNFLFSCFFCSSYFSPKLKWKINWTYTSNECVFAPKTMTLIWKCEKVFAWQYCRCQYQLPCLYVLCFRACACVCVVVSEEFQFGSTGRTKKNEGREWKEEKWQQTNEETPQHKPMQKERKHRTKKKCEKRKLYRLVCVCFFSALPSFSETAIAAATICVVGL